MPNAGLASRADSARLVAAIRDGVPFMALLGGPEQDAVVETAVTALRGDPIAFVRISNPLRSPLSLERLVFQLTAGSDPEAGDDLAARVWRALLNHSAGQKQLVLLVQQAETLAVPALGFLQGLPGLRREGAVALQIVFTGAPQFHALLADDRLRILRDALQAPPALPVREAVAFAAGRNRTRFIVVVAGVAALVAAGAVAALVLPGRQRDSAALHAEGDAPPPAALVPTSPGPSTPGPSTPGPPTPGPPTPAAPSLTPHAPGPAEAPPPDGTEPVTPAVAMPGVGAAEPRPAAPIPAPESLEQARARLYREFTAFLKERGADGRLSQSDRAALFEEYLARHRAAAAAAPPTSTPTSLATGGGASTGPADLPRVAAILHVLLMVPPGSAPSQAFADRTAGLLQGKVTDVAMRPAAPPVAVPTIRYFSSDDRPPALALARDLPAPGGEWRVEEVTAGPGRPDPGTIEIWLPR